jgi:hypothetical protein
VSASSASLGGELSQRDAGTNETSGLNTQRARSLSSITRPLMAQLRQGRIAVARVSDVTVESANAGESEGAVMPLAMQERPLELALNQPTLGSHESQEVTLAQLPGTSTSSSAPADVISDGRVVGIECRVFGRAPLPASGRRYGGGAGWAVTC